MKKCLKNFVFYDGAEVRAHETFWRFSVNKLAFSRDNVEIIKKELMEKAWDAETALSSKGIAITEI